MVKSTGTILSNLQDQIEVPSVDQVFWQPVERCIFFRANFFAMATAISEVAPKMRTVGIQ